MTKLNERQAYGTITTDTTTDECTVYGWTTLSAHLDSGSGTWTWQFKGLDGEWRSVIAGSDYITALEFTATNMANVFFGSKVQVRGNASSGSSPVWDWQINGNVKNKGNA